MMKENEKKSTESMYKDIEEQLLHLPQPAVPAGLEARLLAGIPAGYKSRPTNRRYYLGLAAALAAGLILAFLFRTAETPRSETHSKPGILNNTDPRYILNVSDQPDVKETIPCHILPSS